MNLVTLYYGIRLKDTFSRLYALETNKDASLSERWYCLNGVWTGLWSWRINPRGRSKFDLELLISYLQGVELRVGAEDRLVWSLDQQHSFSVKKLASLIDYNILRDHSLGSKSHTWNSLVPKKVNIHIWRLAKDRLHLLSKLLRLGINVDFVTCPLCGEVPKFIDHIMVHCPKVKPIWLKCFSWWDLKPSHGDGNNVVPLRSDTIRLVQNGCSFHGLRSEDPNQHLKDFLKLVDSLDLDGENRERTRLRLFQFSLRDQASNCLKRLPAGLHNHMGGLLTTDSAHTAFHRKGTLKLRNDILMFQQHHGESLSEAWTRPTPQPQALETTFEARVRDYMAAHTERMERFENAIFKQREEINDRMTKMFRLLKELTTSKAPEKVLIREGAKSPVTKNVNSISLAREEEKENDKHDVAIDDNDKETNGPNIEVQVKEAETKNRAENGVENKPIKKTKNEEVVEAPSTRSVEYYLKHMIDEKLIEGLVDNPRFNDSEARVGKVKGKTYNVSPRGPIYDAILKKKITKKEVIRGNFEIPCNTGGLKHVNALVDQGYDVNVMPYSTYMKLTDEVSFYTLFRGCLTP
ncbi:MAK10-like protein [Tanacetum coccineum]